MKSQKMDPSFDYEIIMNVSGVDSNRRNSSKMNEYTTINYRDNDVFNLVFARDFFYKPECIKIGFITSVPKLSSFKFDSSQAVSSYISESSTIS